MSDIKDKNMRIPRIIFPSLFKSRETIQLTSSEPSERRKDIRLEIIVPLVLNRPTGKQHELLRDLSKTGFRLETETELGIAGIYGFEFTPPDGSRIKLKGEVMWKKDRAGTIYYGIKFSKIGILAGFRLRAFLNKAVKSAVAAEKERGI